MNALSGCKSLKRITIENGTIMIARKEQNKDSYYYGAGVCFGELFGSQRYDGALEITANIYDSVTGHISCYSNNGKT